MLQPQGKPSTIKSRRYELIFFLFFAHLFWPIRGFHVMYSALVPQKVNEASRSPGREAAGQHWVLPAVVGQELERLEQGAVSWRMPAAAQRCPSGNPGGLGSRAQPGWHGSEEAEECRRLGAKSATNLKAFNFSLPFPLLSCLFHSPAPILSTPFLSCSCPFLSSPVPSSLPLPSLRTLPRSDGATKPH